MKNLLLITILSLMIVGCSKDDEPILSTSSGCYGSGIISYPDSNFYGVNILNLPDSFIVLDTGSYSFSATLDCSADLKIYMQNLSSSTGPGIGAIWGYSSGTEDGWMITTYSNQNSSQIFQSNTNNTAKKLMLNMVFAGSGSGFARLDFYENSASVTKSKYLYWQ